MMRMRAYLLSRYERITPVTAQQRRSGKINNYRHYNTNSIFRGYSNSSTDDFRTPFQKEILSLPEHRAREQLVTFLQKPTDVSHPLNQKTPQSLPSYSALSSNPPTTTPLLTPSQINTTIDALFATFHLHVESRIASLCGRGYYTIGPCGEEILSPVAHCLQSDDTLALHYRHLSISITRQLNSGKSLTDVLLDRARGYVTSRYDPVTGGVHCALGGGDNDYVVTSTLSSQCPPAVGRALGFSMAMDLLPTSSSSSSSSSSSKSSSKPISFVTVGDGSTHNAHFLSSLNLARHARYRRIKCPIVFGISDNGLSISYKHTRGYLDTMLSSSSDPLMPLYRADGSDLQSVYETTRRAVSYARRHAAPCVILYDNLVRRFGHAASDRQGAYLTSEEIRAQWESCVVSRGVRDVVDGRVVVGGEKEGDWTYGEMLERFEEVGRLTKEAFDVAVEEERVTEREEVMERVSAPMVPTKRMFPRRDAAITNDTTTATIDNDATSTTTPGGKKKDVMRKHMTRVISETLTTHPSTIYIGEDVEHGGYYLVTDTLSTKHPGRIIDFPPDETTLLGAAMGLSQLSLTPIIEIPYAKYLDCGADMFFEACLSHWLSNGKCSNGMIIRLQGFDRGLFGGNFHTHNALHMPPGVDVVCFSNGEDYVRGWRNAVRQAMGGRVVMVVDSTALLNLRHVWGSDRGWERVYPEDENEVMGFHDVRRYGAGKQGKVGIVSYGNGVVTALRARKILVEDEERGQGQTWKEEDVDVIDCPYISDVPDGLREIIGDYETVIFADVCKEGQHPFAAMSVKLHNEGVLEGIRWKCIAAPKTYNPLGSTITFLNEEDIIKAICD